MCQRDRQAAISHGCNGRCRRELVDQIDISNKQAAIDCCRGLTQLKKRRSHMRHDARATWNSSERRCVVYLLATKESPMKARLVPILILGLLVVARGRAEDQQPTVINVDGERVAISRDEYGVPHVFADTNKALFTGYGYAVAEDRLWQLELFRYAAQGRLAELLGATTVPTNLQIGQSTALAADMDIRTRHYTDAELQQQFSLLNAEEAEIFGSYADGINRYVRDVVAADPANKLPFEFHFLGIGIPAPWTALDVVANAVYQTRFGQAGGQERQNQTLLANLISMHGQAAGLSIFNDLRWADDPDTPVSVPVEGTVSIRQSAGSSVVALADQLKGASLERVVSMEEEADAVLRAFGVPLSTGSHGWVVSAAKSATGSAMLFGGPQVDFNTPELFLEVHLKGGNGFNVMGRAFAGVPLVYAGRTDHMAWAMTSGTFGDTRDTYVETLCDDGRGYLFNGICTPFETRNEVINIKGSPPMNLTVRRTIHGPVVAPPQPPKSGVVFSQKRVVWKNEIESARQWLAIDRARSLQEFEAAVRRLEVSHNFLYADNLGNIAYFFSGKVPIRPAGFDPRLPLPGTGNAEWTGEFRPIPSSVNPARGWLSSWNTKPALGYPNPDQRSFGKQWRSLEIDDRLATGLISLGKMKDIAKDIARTSQGGDGRESRYLKPYLLAALDAVPPTNPLAGRARAVLEHWDGSLFADAITSETLEPGQVVFSKWLELQLVNTFGDELGTQVNQASTNMLIHVLDDALGGGSAVPPSRDYFNGWNPNAVISKSFDDALDALGRNPAAWSTEPRDIVRFRHTLYPAVPEVATMLDSNRATYAYIVVLSNPTPSSESILSLGQSGFIALDTTTNSPVFSPHFRDQIDLYRDFRYKPMRLF
jgi:penicillin amidase